MEQDPQVKVLKMVGAKGEVGCPEVEELVVRPVEDKVIAERRCLICQQETEQDLKVEVH